MSRFDGRLGEQVDAEHVLQADQPGDLEEPGARRDHRDGPAERGDGGAEPHQRPEAASIDERDSGRVNGEVETTVVHGFVETVPQLDGSERVEFPLREQVRMWRVQRQSGEEVHDRDLPTVRAPGTRPPRRWPGLGRPRR